MSTSKTYLITGANRGIGRGLLESLIQRPNVTVIAAVRDANNESSKSLLSLATATGSKVIVVSIESTNESSAKAAIESLKTKYGINKIDVVIANAGISKFYGPVKDTPIQEMRDHFEVNTIGVLVLFQAIYALLTASPDPIFVAISTGTASIGDMGSLPIPSTPYSISKTALNFLVRKIHFENPNITAFSLSPGWVQTEMGNFGATSTGMEKAPVTLEQSVTGILSKVDHATREATSGTFQSFDETQYAW